MRRSRTPRSRKRSFSPKSPALRRERALINAMAVRYTEEEDGDLRPQLDSMYSREMAQAYEDFPDDLDIATLYAESLILLNPTRANYRLGDPFVESFHRVLEDVLDKDINHPGACHIYIHATEATEEPGKAEACADLLGASIFRVRAHINHMPSHTYNRIGRWNSAGTFESRRVALRSADRLRAGRLVRCQPQLAHVAVCGIHGGSGSRFAIGCRSVRRPSGGRLVLRGPCHVQVRLVRQDPRIRR